MPQERKLQKLTNETTGAIVAREVELADTLASRAIGLLGRASLPEGRALWIMDCGTLHTWFMRFAIDVVFVDESMVVRGVRQNLKPWRFAFPGFGRFSAFELPAGALRGRPVAKGDKLHVGD